MDWTEIAKGIILADLWKAGIAVSIALTAGLAYAIVRWLGK